MPIYIYIYIYKFCVYYNLKKGVYFWNLLDFGCRLEVSSTAQGQSGGTPCEWCHFRQHLPEGPSCHMRHAGPAWNVWTGAHFSTNWFEVVAFGFPDSYNISNSWRWKYWSSRFRRIKVIEIRQRFFQLLYIFSIGTRTQRFGCPRSASKISKHPPGMSRGNASQLGGFWSTQPLRWHCIWDLIVGHAANCYTVLISTVV